jgi:Phosphotransferase enzyme family
VFKGDAIEDLGVLRISAVDPAAGSYEDVSSTGRISPLELFHPDGIVERVCVIGDNCPTRLLPEFHHVAGDRADLIILAPSEKEFRTKGWLQNATLAVNGKLAPDGVVYVISPSLWRSTIERLLRNRGFQIETYIGHFPNWESSRYLLPLTEIPARYAFGNLFPTRSWKRQLSRTVLRMPGGGKFLANVLPCVSLVGRRPGERPLFHWLRQFDGDLEPLRSVIVSTSWRGRRGSVVLHPFAGSKSTPSVVMKMGWEADGDFNPANALATLERLRPQATSAGALVPETLSVNQMGRRRVVVQSAAGGQSVAAILFSNPTCLFQIVKQLAAWLERWNLSTRFMRCLDRDLVDQELLAPAATLAPLIERGGEYRSWLAARSAMIGAPVPLVAAHGDLTMWNILLDNRGSLSIVDWEAARESSFPLVDFFYAMTDTVVVARGYDRTKALKECFTPGGLCGREVRNLLLQVTRALEIPQSFTDLCLHACFLRHAVNEQRMSEASEGQPFLKAVQWLALNRRAVQESMSCSG